MPLQIQHREHVYSYDHPVGWSGGDEHVRDQLNASKPAGEYPALDAEKLAMEHALAGALAGGEVLSHQGIHFHAGPEDDDTEMPTAGFETGDPDRILES